VLDFFLFRIRLYLFLLRFNHKPFIMKLLKPTFLATVALIFMLASCNNDPAASTGTQLSQKDSNMNAEADRNAIKEEKVNYKANGTSLVGYVYYDSTATGKRPIVVVVPEWWGLTEYPRLRARKLAELGYVAFAADMYGNGQVASNPQEAQSLATTMYQNVETAQGRLKAALEKAKSYPLSDTSQTAAIGYCFGGSMVLNAAVLGAGFDGVVSFHGGLDGVQLPKSKVETDILICNGAADTFITQEQIDAFTKALDSVGADYTFKSYPDAVHAFTNPNATEMGKKFNMPIAYNAAADTASWNDMKQFFGKLFNK
jgi:dienelactone hydrolase